MNWWKQRGKLSKALIIVGALFVGLIVAVAVDSGNDVPPADTAAATDTTAQAAAETTTTAASPAATLESLVAAALEGDTNKDQPRLRSVIVAEETGGGYSISVEVNADDNLTSGLIKTGIEKHMSEVYIALYQSGLDVRSVAISTFFSLVDKYGAASDGVVYRSILDKAEADKVNWQSDDALLKLDILPGVWTTILVHPDLL